MSLTNILNYNNPDFKEYRSALAKYQIPKFNFEGYEIKAIPRTQHYAIIGTAFDYLLRFTIERNFNNYVESAEWVAENAIEYLQSNSIITNSSPNIRTYNSLLKKKKELSKSIISRYEYIKEVFHYNYTRKYKSLDIDLIKSCLFLAKLDLLTRNQTLDIFEIDYFNENFEDIEDLKTLNEVCDINIFRPQKKIILNPHFGSASDMVGGADADIIVDDILIDIKVSKHLDFTRNYYNQILSYYLLHLMEKMENNNNLIINNLGIYSARYGCLFIIPIKSIGTKESFQLTINILKKNLNSSK